MNITDENAWARSETHLAIQKGLDQVEDDATYEDAERVVNKIQATGLLVSGKNAEVGRFILRKLDERYMSGGYISSENVHRLIDDLMDQGFLITGQ